MNDVCQAARRCVNTVATRARREVQWESKALDTPLRLVDEDCIAVAGGGSTSFDGWIRRRVSQTASVLVYLVAWAYVMSRRPR